MTQKRILIIDESHDTQQLLAQQVLEPNGYRLLAALDGEEGIRLALEEHPDLIVLDIQSPAMNGIEVLKALQQQEADIPVICTTVPECANLVLQAFRLGARDYVTKPLDPREMQEAITRVLASTPTGDHDRFTQQLVETNQELQRRLRALNAMHIIGQSVTPLLDLASVLNRVVEAAVYLVDAEEGMLLLLNSATDELYLRAAKKADEDAAQNLCVLVHDTDAWQVIQTSRPVLLTGERAQAVAGSPARAVLYLPLRVPEQGVIGLLGVVNCESEGAFSEGDSVLLSALADYAAIAIENARLFETVEARRAKLEAVLREAQDGIIVTDGTDKVLLCNSAARAALNLVEDDMLDKSVPEAIRHPALLSMYAQVHKTGEATHSEVPLENGRTFNVQLTPIAGVGYILVMQDFTHLKELDRIKSEFVAAVSHDLRTPLTTIQGYVELLPRVGPLSEQQRDFTVHIRQSLKAITELVNNVLDNDRLEAGLDLEMVPCDLIQVIDETILDFQPLVAAHTQELRWEPPESLPLVLGNPHRLRQVMHNLLSNAIKYTQESGWIEVTALEDDAHVVVHVADNGIGILPAQQPYIFDKFYRVETDETVRITGTGLGLAIVKTVIEKHNGRVWVESKAGVGSVFSFVLPALKP